MSIFHIAKFDILLIYQPAQGPKGTNFEKSEFQTKQSSVALATFSFVLGGSPPLRVGEPAQNPKEEKSGYKELL